MKAYMTLKMMIKYKLKTNEEVKAYCDAYLAAGKINSEQYKELVAMLEKENQ